jgi:hypothetical protein
MPSRIVRLAGFLGALEVRRVSIQHRKAKYGVGRDAREGLMTSCAVDAIITPRLVTRATFASFDLAFSTASSRNSAPGDILNRWEVLRLTVLVPG